MSTRPRYYRIIVESATGRRGTVSFEADDIMLAIDHAQQLCRVHDYTLIETTYVGTAEPTGDFGAFKELP